jgi:putative SOS response-associated peptidase YedK
MPISESARSAAAIHRMQAHYNVAPTDPVDVVKLATGGATELVSMRSFPRASWTFVSAGGRLPAAKAACAAAFAALYRLARSEGSRFKRQRHFESL